MSWTSTSPAGAKVGEDRLGGGPATPPASSPPAGPGAREGTRPGPATLATPKARLVLPPDADEDDWHAARLAGVTASEIAVILGISPFDSAFSLYWHKTGDVPHTRDTARLSLGRHLEPWIVDQWAWGRDVGELTRPGLVASVERPWQLATPDRLVWEHADPVSALEIKTSGTYESWGPDGSDEIPPYIRAQVLWQLDVLGLAEAHVVCFFLSTQQFRTYEITYDPDDVEFMRHVAEGFLDRVHRQDPPPVDDHSATTDALKELFASVDLSEAEVPDDIAEQHRQACADAKAADAAKRLAENKIRAYLGDAKTARDPDGGKVCSRSVYEQTGLDRDRLRRDFPAAWEACRTTTTIDRLNPTRRKG